MDAAARAARYLRYHRQSNGAVSAYRGGIMSDMGTFRVAVEIENPVRRGERVTLQDTLVDTGAELTWAPRATLEKLGIVKEKGLRFRTADGRAVERDIGYAVVHAGGTATIDEVVFAEPGDMILLGARS